MFNEARRNWKTTLAGILAGAVPIVIAYLQGRITVEAVITGIGIAILGALSKDGGVSGTSKNPVP